MQYDEFAPRWARYVVTNHRLYSFRPFWASSLGVARSFAARWGGEIHPV